MYFYNTTTHLLKTKFGTLWITSTKNLRRDSCKLPLVIFWPHVGAHPISTRCDKNTNLMTNTKFHSRLRIQCLYTNYYTMPKYFESKRFIINVFTYQLKYHYFKNIPT